MRVTFWLICGVYACMLAHSSLAVPHLGTHGHKAVRPVDLSLGDALFISENNIGLAA